MSEKYSHSKEKIIKILKKENPEIKGKDKYSELIIVLEVKRLNEETGILKGEYYDSDKLEFRGSPLLPIVDTDQSGKPSIWNGLKPNKSKFFGFTLDSKEAKAHEKIFDFFRRSFEDSTIQDFIPFASRKQKD